PLTRVVRKTVRREAVEGSEFAKSSTRFCFLSFLLKQEAWKWLDTYSFLLGVRVTDQQIFLFSSDGSDLRGSQEVL
ncbi:hypothetical protein ACQP3L_36250, partial [Escherichia coli]